MDDETLTIRKIATLLKIGQKTAYTMAQRGQLPGFKVREQWRFRRADIDAWIAKQLHQKDGEPGEGSVSLYPAHNQPQIPQGSTPFVPAGSRRQA